MAISGVLFDMDGLLVDTEPLWLVAERATMRELGASWTHEDQLAILGGPLEQAARYMVATSGTSLDARAVGEMLIAHMLDLLATAEIPLQPGALALLVDVADRGLPRALVSASLRPLVDRVLGALAREGVPPFPVTVAGDEVDRTKPAPTPYLRAAQLLGIDITRAVVLEDSPNGVQAGWASGATVVAVPHVVRIPPRERVHVLDTLVGLDVPGLEALAASSGPARMREHPGAGSPGAP